MTRPYLIVEAGGHLFAVAQNKVREIVPSREVTRLPGAPVWVKGLLNLRGTLVTIIDLSERFGMGRAQSPLAPVVIFLIGDRLLGALVDDVHEVVEFADGDLLPPPAEGRDATLAGLGHFGERIVLAVDVQELARQTFA